VLLDLVERTKDESLRKARSRHSRPMGTPNREALPADSRSWATSQSAAAQPAGEPRRLRGAAGRAVESGGIAHAQVPLEIVR